MGSASDKHQEREIVDRRALDAAVGGGVVSECPNHPGVAIHLGNGDASSAFAYGTTMFNRGTIPGARKEFMDAIKAVIDSAGDRCEHCAKAMAG